MANKIILASQTAAGNSGAFTVNHDQAVKVQCVPDLAGSETADVQITHDDGVTWVDYIYDTAVELSATVNSVRLYGPATYRVAKDSSSSATAVYLER